MASYPAPALSTKSSALERRARVFLRRHVAVRRHIQRAIRRSLVLITGDLIALLIVRAMMRAVLSHSVVASQLSWNALAIGPFANPGNPGSLVFGVATVIALVVTGSYSRHRVVNTSVRLAAAMVIASAGTAVTIAAVVGVRAAILQSLMAGSVAWLALALGRGVSEHVTRSLWPGARGTAPGILVGSPASFSSSAGHAISAPGSDFRVTHMQATSADMGPAEAQRLITELASRVEQEDAEVIVVCQTLPNSLMRALVELALDAGCRVLYPARLMSVDQPRPRLVWYFDQPFFELGAVALKATAVALKRVTDVIGATLLLAVSLPIMLVIAAGIKLDSRGPVFFAQDRAGLGGKRLRMLKFRTMRDGADAEKTELIHLNQTGDVRLFKIPLDPRTTRFGRFLRRWSLDELPQLLNVLRGEMSLVGPRPFFELDFAAYEDRHFRRLDTKPGITGLWQVSGRSEIVNFEDVVFLDRQYIEQWSFWLDVSILFRTIPAVARRRGAY